jgi:hypothetical protein
MRRRIVFEIILAEFGRALAAARRYESLKIRPGPPRGPRDRRHPAADLRGILRLP